MLKLSHTIVLALIATLHTCNAAFYNVVNFGAKGDGVTDSSSAFLKAWAAPCSSVEQSTMYVPKGTFLVNSIVFGGACKSKMQLQIIGALVAPYDYKSFLSDQAWIRFEYVNGLSVVGGDIDARGTSYWACKRSGANCPFGARVNSTFYPFWHIVWVWFSFLKSTICVLWYENHFLFFENGCFQFPFWESRYLSHFAFNILHLFLQ